VRLLDANVIVRVLTNDVPAMADAARILFDRIEAGEEEVKLLEATVAEVVYVLGSRANYNRSREWITDRLISLLAITGFRMEHKSRCVHALELFAATRAISFADALVAAAALEQSPSEVYSFDQGFDRVEGITRLEPAAT
jgi:predicted nucleic acid-binding protein